MKKIILKKLFAVVATMFIALIAMPQAAQAQTKEAYVVEDGETLTFYYDTNKSSRTGIIYEITYSVPWASSDYENPNERITKAVFDSSFKDYKPTSTRRWFDYCTKLQTIEGLSNLCTSEVTDMSLMFHMCKSLKSLSLSALVDTSKVTDMQWMFGFCNSLESLILSNVDTSNVTNMSSMFRECTSLKTLNLSNFNVKNVRWTTYMFENCTSLTTIYCNDDWKETSLWVYDSDRMFNNCTSLKGAVEYDPNEIYLSMANPTTGYFTYINFAYAVEDENTLTFYCDPLMKTRTGTVYNIHDKLTDYNYIPAWAGRSGDWNDRITKVVFDDTFQIFYPVSTSFWFSYCTTLETIEGLSNLNTKNLTDMSYMFCGCQSLTSLDLSCLNTANATNMNRMFYGCKKLTSINLSNFNTSNVTDMTSMFEECQSLKSVDVSSFNTSKVTTMNGMFDMCFDLTTIYCNDDWKSDVLQESAYMFGNCPNLKGAVSWEVDKHDATMANPTTGYFTKVGAGIDSVKEDLPIGRQGIYNLQGVRLNTTPEQLPAGIYIIDGKKVMKK